MPKLLKLFRSQKRRFSSLPSSSVVKRKKGDGIFRSSSAKESMNKNAATSYPVIETAITYSLSEDEESCNNLALPNIDVEHPKSTEELKGEKIVESVSSQPTGTNESARNQNEVIKPVVHDKSSSKDISETMSKSEKTITFTHLEIMRNELTHLMQIAEKDREISALKKAAEVMTLRHAQGMESKDNEILRINNVVTELELALSATEEKLDSMEQVHSKTIEALMKAQYDYHQLKTNSWFAPLLC
mmetsp:Transcript_18825/g.52598  ORF Transcript_18825/g.52598 Transcript_18825/m.52598 type:complete len:245 (-) Transcript_18825:237-971(-)|eukprot:CAMPEP_0172367328 /NCGR_PEP_ID=MMETSP1060-20121228/20753_1 /TAXON_ID=37318 /ORGANISM="Pseudo-nitzschia pungens, Strain cf. cingulata" /LENGTH=244 /DNA_ID=CAMNT_0013091541 /DNA_START=45 /DNA_END=779 /DNA_ORIENTATION=+